MHALLTLALVPLAAFTVAGAAHAAPPQPHDAPAPARAAEAEAPSHETRAARARRPKVTLTASHAWIRKGQVVTLRGTVRGAGRGTRVTILQRSKGGRRWGAEGTVRTKRHGRFVRRDDIRTGTRDYKACVRGRCSRPVRVNVGRPPTPPPPPAAATAVSIDPPASGVEAGAPLALTGGATFNLEGQTVRVEAYDVGSQTWGGVGQAVVSGGRWSGSAVVTTAGKAIGLRVVFPGASGLAASASGQVNAVVYGWYYLYDGTPDSVASSYHTEYDTFAVNGTTYSKSVGLSGGTGYTSYAEFNLSRSCTRFAATIGLDDTANTVTRSTGRIIVDSVTKWTQAGMGLGRSFPVDVPVTGGLRLRLENTETTSGSGYLVFGDARALCAF